MAHLKKLNRLLISICETWLARAHPRSTERWVNPHKLNFLSYKRPSFNLCGNNLAQNY